MVSSPPIKNIWVVPAAAKQQTAQTPANPLNTPTQFLGKDSSYVSTTSLQGSEKNVAKDEEEKQSEPEAEKAADTEVVVVHTEDDTPEAKEGEAYDTILDVNEEEEVEAEIPEPYLPTPLKTVPPEEYELSELSEADQKPEPGWRHYAVEVKTPNIPLTVTLQADKALKDTYATGLMIKKGSIPQPGEKEEDGCAVVLFSEATPSVSVSLTLNSLSETSPLLEEATYYVSIYDGRIDHPLAATMSYKEITPAEKRLRREAEQRAREAEERRLAFEQEQRAEEAARQRALEEAEEREADLLRQREEDAKKKAKKKKKKSKSRVGSSTSTRSRSKSPSKRP